MPSSFKRCSDLTPIRYRTPSPPRYAFEPISPILTGAAADELPRANTTERCNRGFKRNYLQYEYSDLDECEQKYLLRGPMDAFASIALATKLSGRHRLGTSPSIQVVNDEYHDTDRPYKRTRSEKLSPLDWSRTTEGASLRPATSYEQSSESRRLEAELLLNFAHEAAKLVCSPQEPSGPLSSIQSEPISKSPGECGGGFIENDSFNITDPLDQAEARMVSHGGRAIDGKRSASEADARQETHLEQRKSNEVASEMPHTTFNRSEIATKHLSPTALAQQSDLDILPKALEIIAGNTSAKTVDRSEVGDRFESLGATVAREPQEDTVMADQNHGSVANINEESQNSIFPDRWYNEIHPEPQGTMQLTEHIKLSLEDAVEASEGEKGVNRARIKDLTALDALDDPQEEVLDNESDKTHGAKGNQVRATNEIFAAKAENTKQSTPEVSANSISASDGNDFEGHPRLAIAAAAVCASCNFSRNSPAIETDNDATSWISCDGCKSWFHFACAGFKNDREVRSVDKYRCRKCKPLYGSTTYVRKSSRAHSAIDYAGLHQGVIKTSDERPEHHYIKPIKDGTIAFSPENFARMRPELVTSEFFEKGTGMREPIIIPACFNPRPNAREAPNTPVTRQPSSLSFPDPLDDGGVAEDWLFSHTEPEIIIDQGQDALDMVIPQGLTVRRVAEIYGQDEKVEVIDVKSQNGENKKWNMRRWVDYYENPSNKVVRNVISLEVSQSKLGRLIRRPQIVRDLDLQDSVWPQELLAKGEYPRVQFYCLMSVADCFTDFHIDFGGSSVFYHILKGKKTFLFIPPKEKYLKKYEEWCMSPAQNWTFLGDQTKECYRVDLSEGDTMLIPAGWIHAVWTPEDSLVIGGNFLTRLNFGMQLRVAQVEKATGVARKFRYPHFQKLHWYTVLRYLENDPLPRNVQDLLYAGNAFVRQQLACNEFDLWGENSRPGVENYHTRYYSQSELDGLPDLLRYLLRTALIDIGSITDGISVETRNAVKKSIPRGHGEPFDVLKTFAAWCAWKRGNEPIPHWAYPDAGPKTLAPDKLSAAAMRKLDREAALQAPRRQSARMQSQQAVPEVLPISSGSAEPILTPKKSRTSSAGTNGTSHRKTACESCRKRRRACKHKDQVALSTPPQIDISEGVSTHLSTPSQNLTPLLRPALNDGQDSSLSHNSNRKTPESKDSNLAIVSEPSSTARTNGGHSCRLDDVASQSNLSVERPVSQFTMNDEPMLATMKTVHEFSSGNATSARPRHKACNECRKSKRRCIHDEHGNEDPIKVRESAIPRPHARKSNAQIKENSTPKKHVQGAVGKCNFDQQMRRPAPIANMIAGPGSPVIKETSISSLADNFPQASSAEPFPLDPALFEDGASNIQYEEQTTVLVTLHQPTGSHAVSHHRYTRELSDRVADRWQINHSYPASDIEIGTATLESRESFEPPASSLVSPPASSHDDAGISPITAHAGWTSSTDSSRHSSSPPKHMQRYTPESGSMRRASNSSYGENAQEKAVLSVNADLASGEMPEARAIFENRADEESLKLIKELQAEEYGLRRRGKA